ncbi:hypothetical protein WICPIJ_009074 [Wickerhamomyces pijperi]|uniref:Uncharacterized protein n=1 Tax=Wickerhamomyces pijperi TaxID=599730 RepID=A0A9P8PS70_WICPI|nr:hypothetical protein WICPIJ_009074 [Wickerhamomyces pijperi]
MVPFHQLPSPREVTLMISCSWNARSSPLESLSPLAYNVLTRKGSGGNLSIVVDKMEDRCELNGWMVAEEWMVEKGGW